MGVSLYSRREPFNSISVTIDIPILSPEFCYGWQNRLFIKVPRYLIMRLECAYQTKRFHPQHRTVRQDERLLARAVTKAVKHEGYTGTTFFLITRKFCNTLETFVDTICSFIMSPSVSLHLPQKWFECILSWMRRNLLPTPVASGLM